MPMFQSKNYPVLVEAVRFNGDAALVNAIEHWMAGNELHIPNFNLNSTEALYVKTPAGTIRAMLGDYIVKRAPGEFYPIRPAIFEAAYERIHDELSPFA